MRQEYVIATYFRLSSEDIEYNNVESESILNQRMLVNGFIHQNEEFKNATIKEFCDDGYSGKNFNRPAIKKLLQLTNNGEIDCIVVKDFSRFGRDMVEVGHYLEHAFPFIGVRFISLNDNYDSKNITDIGSLDAGFRTLINDIYSRELSEKSKQAKLALAKKGKCINSTPPYGYIKENKKYVIDEEPAKIVKRIFDYKIMGYSTTEIAKILNHKNTPTPMMIKKKNGVRNNYSLAINDTNCWTRGTVRNVLKNMEYTGRSVYGKKGRVDIADTRLKKKPREEWVITPNTHTPIISDEIYNQVQKMMQSSNKSIMKKQPFLYKKIRCKSCGYALSRKNGILRCESHKITDEINCFKGRITQKEIKRILIECIIDHARHCLNLYELQKENTRDIMAKIDEHNDSIKKATEKVNQYYIKLMNCYEKKFDGHISEDYYKAQVAKIQNQKNKINNKITQMQNEVEVMKGNLLMLKKQRSFTDLLSENNITNEVMNDLVKMVYLETDGTIEVTWTFRDTLKN
ncbi:MAG: recombinase family protein [Clostridia bacterium]|nr:recombinase family protein [Clostridia bacterium]